MGPGDSGGGQGGQSAQAKGASTGTYVKAGGSLIKALGAYEAAKFNRKVARWNQRNAGNDAVGEERQLRDFARKSMGEQIAAQGASGVQLGTGSALDALHESAVNEQLDIMALRRKAAIRSTGYDIEAANAKAEGTAALWNGVFEAAGAFAGGGDYAAAGSAG